MANIKTVADELRKELLRAFDNGKSILEMSSIFGLSRATISRVLKEEGRTIKRGRPTKNNSLTAVGV